MSKRLTDRTLKNAKPHAERYELSDGGSGLYFAVQPKTGAISGASRFRIDGRPKKYTHGTYPAISLAEMRERHAVVMAKVAKGIDPTAEKRQAQIEAGERAGDTVERWAAVFLEQHVRAKTRPQSQRSVERTFRLYVLPAWRTKSVGDIRRRDIIELIHDIARTAPFQANRSLAHLSRFFRWLLNRDVIDSSPALAIERPAKETPRERLLSDDEIRRLWIAAGQVPAPYGDIYRLLLLSGARRQEIAEMTWGELDLEKKLWMLPGERAKNGSPAILPLGKLAWQIIERQPRDGGYVFPRHSDFSRAKVQLDELMKPDKPWVFHDLRRVARSLLSRARVPQDLSELCLHHLPHSMRRRYDRHQYLDEKREAFEKLEREVDLILNPLEAAVVPFRR